MLSLERVLGEEVRIVSREIVPVNRMIQAEYIQILQNDTAFLSEDTGRLLLYPVADGIYHLHLLFVLPGTESEICWFRFQPEFFELFDPAMLAQEMPFRFDQTAEQQFSLGLQIKNLLEQFKATRAVSSFLQNLQLSELAIQLFRRVMEQVTVPFNPCPVPACRFLANETEREKIIEARRILEQTVDQPVTIRELSRKVAMNECYLKKGFKTLTGKTINEYQQELRILKAKTLLSQQGNTVSDVANMLGYSSISHFSTAFKKATGIKPCELLG